MPSSVVKSFAKKYNKSIDEVETLWDIAKKQALHIKPISDPTYWAIVTGLLKKKLRTESLASAILKGSDVVEVITSGSLGITQVSPKPLKCSKCNKLYIDTDICPYCGEKVHLEQNVEKIKY